MASIREAISTLSKMRGLFHRRLSDAAKETVAEVAKEPALREIKAFGSNPGSLRMFAHVPHGIGPRPPLVVALHGCTQSAAQYARGTGWSQMADRHAFVVIYPEQQSSNNPKNCFSWFVPNDTSRAGGEALSIRQMIETAVINFGIDPSRIFITGLSAGGAMTSAMLAAYPEVFAGGAIIGGLPYGSASNVQQAFDAMFNDRAPSARALGDRVRAASKHQGRWPRISVWHGTADSVVKPSNAEHIVSQWINVKGLGQEPSELQQGVGYARRVWLNSHGHPVLEAISVAGMGHGVPLATTGQDACGRVGPFFLDAGVSSTSHIVRFWQLESEAYGHAAPPVGAGGLLSGEATEQEPAVRDQPIQVEAEPVTVQAESRSNPNEVIAAAFKAAGLPPPSGSIGTPSALPDPGAIIDAALKAAGLMRR